MRITYARFLKSEFVCGTHAEEAKEADYDMVTDGFFIVFRSKTTGEITGLPGTAIQRFDAVEEAVEQSEEPVVEAPPRALRRKKASEQAAETE